MFQTSPDLLRRAANAGRAALLCAMALLGAAGCANPGPPRPPSLNLPEGARDLLLQRVGDAVEASWTTPRLTTDRTAISGPVTAVLCRDRAPNGLFPAPPAARPGCFELLRKQVSAGAASRMTVQLPADLTSGPARPLLLHLQLRNQVGRFAERSASALTAAGTAPPGVLGLAVFAHRDGALLTWTALPDAGNSRVELVRRTLSAPAEPGPGRTGRSAGPPGLPGARPQPTVVHLAAAAAPESAGRDLGGLLDSSVQSGATYSYVAQRVEVVSVGGATLRLSGPPSAAVTLRYVASFPPDPPRGLQAIPGGAPAAARSHLSIDLSWEPSAQQDVLGYNIYRSAGENPGMVRLNQTPVQGLGFSDESVTAGQEYRYRITAVDTHGNESAPGNEVVQTAEQ